MDVPDMPVLVPTNCEWCSTGFYQRKTAEFVVVTAFGGTTASTRLCDKCATATGGVRVARIVPVADTLPLLDAADVAAYLDGETWTRARTVPEYPHEYLLLTRSTLPMTHLRVVRFIRKNGERRQWAPSDGPAKGTRIWCTYWPVGNLTYWTQPADTDPILNRRQEPSQ